MTKEAFLKIRRDSPDVMQGISNHAKLARYIRDVYRE